MTNSLNIIPEKLAVVKIGGNIIDDEAQLSSFLNAFAAIDGKKILVHGGGKLATRVAEAMGISQEMVNGRRITDAETLKVVTMVYAGFINKNIVAQLQAAGCNAIGLSGADGNIIQGHKRIATTIDYGFVGDIDAVNAGFVKQLLSHNAALVLSPITHNGNGQLLNTNADTIAQEIAKAMSAYYEVSLLYCFEKKGVLLDPADDSSIIPVIDRLYFEKLKEDLVISAGMIPKLDNAFEALSAGVQHIFIGHAAELPQLILHQSGTSIVHE
ncbi:acetylglutamate kinase [Ferruginibacter sp. HRS2-29]|uniref:acetylglutamate kinase n=1 Tax=Ferruginibacter sp. HRS2-29 TaxID=2487334 RepID=UPI0020CE1584|nr:acetylglutamate kinase [Ferruginibacter sp. HRS2-29]MCP9753380.1 acetylglutamate kinase [Ferruginibacter sp. HRS2-29]